MRLTSKFGESHPRSKVFLIRSDVRPRRHRSELTAFRGFLFAGSASALLWGVGLAALWLLVWKK